MKCSRKHDPGACQCCKGGGECVDDQDRSLPVRGGRRSSASAEDVMLAVSRQKSVRTLQGGRNDWRQIPYYARSKECGPDANGNPHYYRGTSEELTLALPACRGPGNEER